MKRVGISAFVIVAMAACRTYDTTYTDDAGGACIAPRIQCQGVCVDPLTDRLNCNNCGTTCAVNALCENGACTPCPNSEVACGSSGAAFCTDTTADARNCGVCGNACAQGTTCKTGQCTCPLTTCGTECVDLQTDAAHCGACDTPCPSPGPHETAVCTAAHCGVVCTAPFADCDGQGGNGCEANLLTGTTSCGACGRTCAGNGACAGGMCATVTYVQNAAQLGGTAVDSSFVYWADRSVAGAIDRAPIAGGTPQTYYADNVATVLASDATHLVWLHLNTQIDSRLLSGGAVSVLANASGILALTVDSGFVYYGTSAGVVARVPVDGSSGATTITSVSSPQSIAADATNVYVVNVAGDVVYAPVSATNAIASTLAAGAGALALALDANNVYWIASSGDIVSHAKTSSSSTTLAKKQTLATSSNLVTDGSALFWGGTDGAIRELAVGGGAPFVLATNQNQIVSVAVDATNVYWTSTDHVASTSK